MNIRQNNRWNIPTIIVNLRRGENVESIHRVHAVISDAKGRILMSAGDSQYEAFIRSALKPFQSLTFISSGAADAINCGEKGIAISCGSHSGESFHAREAFKILWNSKIELQNLKCSEGNKSTAILKHNCSGKHAAFLSTCKKMGWSLSNYLDIDHPLQIAITSKISEILKIKRSALREARDDCGSPTFLLKLSQIALLYSNLTSSNNAEMEKICRAMLAYPEFVAGEGMFDTELMKRSHGQIISKGGSEGIQCMGKVGAGIGIAIKVEDGSKRAKHAVALHILKQLEWITPIGLQELEDKIFKLSPAVTLEVEGSLRFQENQKKPDN